VSDEPLDPLGRLSYLVKRLELGVRTRMDDQLRALGTTAHQFSVLTTLRRLPGLSTAELARYSKVSPQAMSQLVTGLERRGLVGRTPDLDHQKVMRLHLTASGQRIQRVCDAVVVQIERELLGAVPEDDQEPLLASLRACCTVLGMLEQPRPGGVGAQKGSDKKLAI
jgi:DNA-binding MarR family transcriptional regulator